MSTFSTEKEYQSRNGNFKYRFIGTMSDGRTAFELLLKNRRTEIVTRDSEGFTTDGAPDSLDIIEKPERHVVRRYVRAVWDGNDIMTFIRADADDSRQMVDYTIENGRIIDVKLLG